MRGRSDKAIGIRQQGRRVIKQRVDWNLPPANCIRSECRTSNVPTAENDRFRFFRRGSVVDPGGRVDTRPYEAGGRRRARGYAPLRSDAFRNVGAANFNPQGDRKFSILPFQFSIQPRDGGQSLAALR